jgi:hypothetical protein
MLTIIILILLANFYVLNYINNPYSSPHCCAYCSRSFGWLTVGASARWQSGSYYNASIPATISTTGERINARQAQSSYW